VAYHTSSRNTGKVHAPFLYDPQKKKIFAKASYLGFEMWRSFAMQKNLPFQNSGVLEVALDQKGVDRLEKYLSWGIQNGLAENELEILDQADVSRLEPKVKCIKAIYCKKDGSVNYGVFTNALMEEGKNNGVQFLLNQKAKDISIFQDKVQIKTDSDVVVADFIVNASGGQAIDIAHKMDMAQNFTDIHFRGEYWRAEPQYSKLTNLSIYSVPKHTEYPFLDPHWIVRIDGTVDVGPNAVPVFSPYGYGWQENTSKFLPKIFEMLGSGARKMIFDSQFQSLAKEEILSSLSKGKMINRVQEFLPDVRSSWFKKRGTAGIRSSVIDEKGKFVPDAIIQHDEHSIHVINYNSPGATGALPFSVHIINQMLNLGVIKQEADSCGLWSFSNISNQMMS
jgi:L-2-hydroxyglutarate oxidase